MLKKYECIEEIEVEKWDEDERVIENEFFYVEKGEIWDHDSDYEDYGSEVRLTKGFSWLKLRKEIFESCFKEIEE